MTSDVIKNKKVEVHWIQSLYHTSQHVWMSRQTPWNCPGKFI